MAAPQMLQFLQDGLRMGRTRETWPRPSELVGRFAVRMAESPTRRRFPGASLGIGCGVAAAIVSRVLQQVKLRSHARTRLQ